MAILSMPDTNGAGRNGAFRCRRAVRPENPDPEMTVKHAYYSAKMAEKCGSCFWKRDDGTEVEVTWVCESSHNLKWDDVEDRGPVVSWSRGLMRPLLPPWAPKPFRFVYP